MKNVVPFTGTIGRVSCESGTMHASTDKFPQGEIPEQLNIAGHFLDPPAVFHPARPAIVGQPSEQTCGELATLANRPRNALLAQRVCRADRVLLVLPHSAEFFS